MGGDCSATRQLPQYFQMALAGRKVRWMNLVCRRVKRLFTAFDKHYDDSFTFQDYEKKT